MRGSSLSEWPMAESGHYSHFEMEWSQDNGRDKIIDYRRFWCASFRPDIGKDLSSGNSARDPATGLPVPNTGNAHSEKNGAPAPGGRGGEGDRAQRKEVDAPQIIAYTTPKTVQPMGGSSYCMSGYSLRQCR